MKNKLRSLRWLLLSAPLLFSPLLMADETEIYFADKSSEVKPNILFLLDFSGSMGQKVTGDTLNRSRIKVLQDSFDQVMQTASPNLNVGLIHYANHGLGNDYWWSSIKGVNFPATPIDAKVEPLIAPYKNSDNLPNPATSNTTVREFLASVVNSWSANGYTPIVDSLYEAARYYRGDAVGWGRDVPSLGWAAHPLTYDTALSCTKSHDEACVKSWDQCNNNIVPGSCNTIDYNVCANWITTGSDGSGYCENNDYSKIESIETCKHTICDAINGTPKYKSPIAYKCQANYLVLMSDGKPEYPYYPGLGDKDGTQYYPPSVKDPASSEINAAARTAEIKVSPKLPAYMGESCADSPNGYKSGTCGPELTHWLASTDQNTSLTGNQIVDTYAVGFAMKDEPTGAAYLQSLVTKKDGFFAAENATELAGAFSSILSSISNNVSSFSSPTYTVDQNTLLSNTDEVYIPMFSRDSAPLWSGNLKKFKRQQYTQSDGTVASKIVDKNGATAVNEKGEFTKTAYDFWGDAMSGQDVATGGAASQLPAPAARKLYTDVGTASDLTNADNKLDSSNSLITSTMLAGTYTTANSLMDFFGGEADGISCLGSYKDCNGGSHYVIGDPSTNAGCVNIKQVTTCPIAGSSITTEQRTQLLDFVRGVGIDGKPRKHMGDMLNSKPMVVDYGAAGQRIFAATNEGFLHSIDTTTGVEKWAFMPNSLLDNINTFYKNTPSEAHVYGIDGPLTIWNYDKNLDGKINAADGDKRVMFFGLRRGGNSYYAIDITSPDNPAILWKKENSLGIDDGTWNVLGETWSKPTLAKMRIGNASSSELRDVLVFGAGYDAAKDTEVARTADKLGRDVMIVDALTGELHWSLQRDVLNGFSGSDFDNPIPSNTNRLKDSVPGDIRVLDMDRNGALDRLYFADTGGNLWRVDMDHDVRDADTSMYDYKDAVLTKIASLGTDGNYGKDTRKFFYEPDVALIQNNGKVLMTIALGSGYRTHPLNTNTNDRFYVLMDPNVYNEPPADFAPIKNSDLINARAAIGATGGFKSADDSLLSTNYKGWYYAFSNTGEKVLAPAVTFLNKAVFTTFAPVDAAGAGPTGDPCDTPPNSARAYVLDLFTGRAVANLDRSADKSKDDSVVAGVNEILSAAQIVFRIPTASDGTTCTEGDCKQTVEIRVGKMNLPLMDDSNSDNANTGNSTSDIAGKTDLSGILPRIFWRDHDVSGGN